MTDAVSHESQPGHGLWAGLWVTAASSTSAAAGGLDSEIY